MADGTSETSAQRLNAMLQTAFCPPVRTAMDDPATIEIMVNPDGTLWTETADQGITQTHHVLSAEDRDRVIRLVAANLGPGTGTHQCVVSAELPESGARFEGILPPVSPGPCYSIRKLSTLPFRLSDYVVQRALSPSLAESLRRLIEQRANIVIAGGTSSGKTSFANALLADSSFAGERILVLEDIRELICPAANLVTLRTQPPCITLRDLVRSTLRLRPDRIIVGEVRGGEALDLLKAWNTGHPGGVTTLHANSAQGALTRLEQLVAEATSCSPQDLIAEAIDVVIFMSRSGGQRRVDDAIRVLGRDAAGYRTEPLIAPPLSLLSQGHAS